jgi:hypothetical protein
MEQNKIPHDPRHLGVPLGASKMFRAYVRTVRTMQLSCIKIGTISKRTKTSFHLVYHGVRPKRFLSLRTFHVNRAPLLHRCWLCLQSDQNNIPNDPRHQEVPSGASKTISEPIVQSVQTMHIYCVKVSTISKLTEMSFHLSLVIAEYQRVRPKRLLSLRYIWRKPRTYVALTLIPSLNGPKQDLTWPTPPRGSIGCVQIDFWAYGTFSAIC